MPLRKLLIANRGEVAVRIARAAGDLGLASVAVAAADEVLPPHARFAAELRVLPGRGVAAYLDALALVATARDAGCDALHPGYGFLSESAALARACAAAGITFVGPSAETLDALGDKVRARDLAASLGVPVLAATGPATLEEARAFFESLGPGAGVAVKARAGGGGRGIRIVRAAGELDEAYARARAEAVRAFGDDAVYVERLLVRARHVEVQSAGDGRDAVALFERDCSLQRRRQKLVEVAPAPGLSAALRARLTDAALALARAVALETLATFEFLIDLDADDGAFAFVEANPRLQVEHTVTEEVLGIDLVRAQLLLAGGATLADAGLADVAPPRGFAVEARVNAETLARDGSVVPASGTLARFDLPSGPGVRVDTYAAAGVAVDARFDSLVAKVIVRSASSGVADAYARLRRALGTFAIDGVATNVPFLMALLERPELAAAVPTTFVDDYAHVLAFAAEEALFAGADGVGEDGTLALRSPVQGRVVAVEAVAGARVRAGATLAVLDAMKMEHVVVAPRAGVVAHVAAVAGDVVSQNDVIVVLAPSGDDAENETVLAVDLDAVRGDLAEALARRARTRDEARPEAVERRHRAGGRTARENVADLCDPGTFVEYGALIVPAQRRRRALEDLIQNAPADGLVSGIGHVNGTLFPPAATRCLVLAYDYTVLAGTQGFMNHKKTDRMLALAERERLPVVFFLEGGGGRPGDTDAVGVAGLDVPTFASYARLGGLVPRVGVVAGRCFAGNAALLGCSDVIIATANASIGMGGPAMIEGGGLGVVAPELVGPLSVQVPNGVVDVAVADEAEAVVVAKRYLGYFQGALAGWTSADPRALRAVVPEHRLRAYDVRRALALLADEGSVLELRAGFAPGMVTALARVEGRPLGIVANNPLHLAGAIDANGADKAARFMQLCDAFGLPLLFLCDTPGFMVGPEAEKTALVRHAARLFLTSATLGVPVFTIVLRKGYGLGAMAMAGGSFAAGSFTVAWPTGEFGAMGLEGAVRLGFRKELDAAPADEREALFARMVAAAYEQGKALNTASFLEIDEVIDPAESRTWIASLLQTHVSRAPGSPRRRTLIDAW